MRDGCRAFADADRRRRLGASVQGSEVRHYLERNGEGDAWLSRRGHRSTCGCDKSRPDPSESFCRKSVSGIDEQLLPWKRNSKLLQPSVGPAGRQRCGYNASVGPRPLGEVSELHRCDRLLHVLSDSEQRHVDVDEYRVASFNGGTITIRRPFSRGFSFDFNYTLSHSIDNGGGPEPEEGRRAESC